MSSYNAKAINPVTGKVEEAIFHDNYYGLHRYGIEFKDGDIYREEDIELSKERQKTNSPALEKGLEEFDKKFYEGLMTEGFREFINKGGASFEVQMEDKSKEAIKSFIRSLASAIKAEVLEEVEREIEKRKPIWVKIMEGEVSKKI